MQDMFPVTFRFKSKPRGYQVVFYVNSLAYPLSFIDAFRVEINKYFPEYIEVMDSETGSIDLPNVVNMGAFLSWLVSGWGEGIIEDVVFTASRPRTASALSFITSKLFRRSVYRVQCALERKLMDVTSIDEDTMTSLSSFEDIMETLLPKLVQAKWVIGTDRISLTGAAALVPAANNLNKLRMFEGLEGGIFKYLLLPCVDMLEFELSDSSMISQLDLLHSAAIIQGVYSGIEQEELGIRDADIFLSNELNDPEYYMISYKDVSDFSEVDKASGNLFMIGTDRDVSVSSRLFNITRIEGNVLSFHEVMTEFVGEVNPVSIVMALNDQSINKGRANYVGSDSDHYTQGASSVESEHTVSTSYSMYSESDTDVSTFYERYIDSQFPVLKDFLMYLGVEVNLDQVISDGMINVVVSLDSNVVDNVILIESISDSVNGSKTTNLMTESSNESSGVQLGKGTESSSELSLEGLNYYTESSSEISTDGGESHVDLTGEVSKVFSTDGIESNLEATVPAQGSSIETNLGIVPINKLISIEGNNVVTHGRGVNIEFDSGIYVASEFKKITLNSGISFQTHINHESDRDVSLLNQSDTTVSEVAVRVAEPIGGVNDDNVPVAFLVGSVVENLYTWDFVDDSVHDKIWLTRTPTDMAREYRYRENAVITLEKWTNQMVDTVLRGNFTEHVYYEIQRLVFQFCITDGASPTIPHEFSTGFWQLFDTRSNFYKDQILLLSNGLAVNSFKVNILPIVFMEFRAKVLNFLIPYNQEWLAKEAHIPLASMLNFLLFVEQVVVVNKNWYNKVTPKIVRDDVVRTVEMWMFRDGDAPQAYHDLLRWLKWWCEAEVVSGQHETGLEAIETVVYNIVRYFESRWGVRDVEYGAEGTYIYSKDYSYVDKVRGKKHGFLGGPMKTRYNMGSEYGISNKEFKYKIFGIERP